MPAARLFMAIDVGPEVTRELASCRRSLSAALDGVRWVGAEALPLTLCFLGDTPMERLEPLESAIAAALPGQGPVACEVRGLGVFPGPRRPAVLWAGVSVGAEALAALANRLRGAIQREGFAVDEKPFAAHVTLGRFRRDARVRARVVEDLLKPWRETCFGGLTVDRITLYASALTPAGPVHEALRSWPLPPDA